MINKQRFNRVCVSAAALMLATGCSAPDTTSAPVRELLESGEERITYNLLPDRPLHFHLQYSWNVWNSGGEYLFNEIADVAGGTGSFFLLDSGNKQVVELAPDGNLLNSFSRFGSGPGEFNYPIYLTFHENDIWISDVGNRRFSIYNLEGTYIKDVRWPGASRLVNPFSVTEGGRILHGGMWPLTVAELANQDPLYYLALFPAEGEWQEGRAVIHVDTLATMEALPYMSTEIHSEQGDVRMWFGHPELAPRLLWAAAENLIVTVTSAQYRFIVRMPDAFSSNGNILIRRITEDGLDRFEVGIVDWSDSGINPGH